MEPLRLSIVVPALDEAAALQRCLPAARSQADELIVSDGGSGDGTAAVASALGARVVCGPPGRGPQLNRGAAAASGDVLLFLHADTLLPPQAGEGVRRAVAAGRRWGAFPLAFDDPSWRFRLTGRLISWRTRLTGLPLGDQAQFVTRRAFAEIGGFRDWPVLEDLDLARRLRRQQHPALLPWPVTTAARRYRQRGLLRTVVRNWLIWALFVLGVPPRRLAGLYRHVR
ncbi:MAG TPA: TIGR04283 family arsenosugar biosynthesis glycosyltransferase [Thermoanaerobaculia bacterium]|nr:TIGR04283 family arsenosugar biosynthesis glycosyltransferase [Thermoanaerobaculia bacterium]